MTLPMRILSDDKMVISLSDILCFTLKYTSTLPLFAVEVVVAQSPEPRDDQDGVGKCVPNRMIDESLLIPFRGMTWCCADAIDCQRVIARGGTFHGWVR